ncbi:MAG TPA: DUF1643 domain-containing protein [Methylocella sp.]|jgi:hypothetical protein
MTGGITPLWVGGFAKNQQTEDTEVTRQGSEQPVVQRGADISPCKKYRYRLTRTWDERPALTFVMLNPSWADAKKDDNTITRCVAFATREGAGGIIVVNLYALRESDPGRLKVVKDPFGPDNEAALIEVATKAVRSGQPIVCAWGINGPNYGGDKRAMDILQLAGARLVCLGKTKDGHPRHPGRLPANQPLEPFP